MPEQEIATEEFDPKKVKIQPVKLADDKPLPDERNYWAPSLERETAKNKTKDDSRIVMSIC
jgi:hypothetical protein